MNRAGGGFRAEGKVSGLDLKKVALLDYLSPKNDQREAAC